ncbi:hypothetical protein V8G54_015088 [Vigna mungo]|uniref:Uncharacterized protein n=1 Tax=Vigna mungo TaxID=3915 RepID=A0AAQ3NKJ4_VIGMU
MRLPVDVPSVFLQSVPVSSSPFSILTMVSPGVMDPLSFSLCQLEYLIRFIALGMMRLKTCFPVHNGSGFNIAGVGTFPSKSSHHINMFMKTSFGIKVSLLVIFLHPKSESWTIPITGLFDCGDTMHLGTIISSNTSALVSKD